RIRTRSVLSPWSLPCASWIVTRTTSRKRSQHPRPAPVQVARERGCGYLHLVRKCRMRPDAVASRAMTRFVVDCRVVLRLVEEEIEVAAGHELLAPTLLRSQTLSALHESVHRGEIEPDVAFDRLRQVSALPIRLLGDAVLRRNAWKVADQLGWADTYDAE